jgi:hypothetical protein
VFQIPYMAGAGGNLVVLLPNGITAFRFADGDNNDVDTMVLAGEALRPFPCPAGSGETPSPQERQPLRASDLRAEFPGNTFYADPLNVFPGPLGIRFNLFVAADGVVYGTWKDADAIRRRSVAHHVQRALCAALPHMARVGWPTGTLLRRAPGGGDLRLLSQ